MITFDPPVGFHDVSEYTFVGDDRRVTVRHTTGVGTPDDLKRIGEEYATQIKDLFGATRVDVSEVKTREDGTAYVIVTATAAGPGARAAAERSAFVLFRNGVAIHLTLMARPDDADAPQAFVRLLDSLRPAAATPGQRTAGSLASLGGTAARRAGPAWIELPGRYQDRTVHAFRNPEGTRHLTVNVAEVAAPERAAPPAPLFTGLTPATDDRGRDFAFESGPNPWAARATRARAAAALGEQRAAGPVGEERTATEIRQVGGQRVTVQVWSSEPDLGVRKLAEEVARSVRPGQ